MAANDSHNPTPTQSAPHDPLSRAEMFARLEEEVSRAARHRTALTCLLVSLEETEQLAREHGNDMPAKALAYLADAVTRQLRCFDRVGHTDEGELFVLLPGADEQRGEIVARRTLSRLHSIKIEAEGRRRPLRVSMGIAAWRDGVTGKQLLSHSRLAAQRGTQREERENPRVEGSAGGATRTRPLGPS